MKLERDAPGNLGSAWCWLLCRALERFTLCIPVKAMVNLLSILVAASVVIAHDRSNETGAPSAVQPVYTDKIQVVFNVVHHGTAGNLSQTQINTALGWLNTEFAATGYQFELKAIMRRDDEIRFISPNNDLMCSFSNFGAHPSAHPAENHLNIYTHNAPGTVFGRFPWAFAESDCRQGVFLYYQSLLPGTNQRKQEIIHEVGHYLGLYHTFHSPYATGPCDWREDGIADTPPHEQPSIQPCDAHPSCLPGVPAPRFNYMNSVGSGVPECRTQFTTAQIARMQWAVSHFRPSLTSKIHSNVNVSNNNFYIEIEAQGPPPVWSQQVVVKAASKISSSGGLEIYPGMNVAFRSGGTIELSGTFETGAGSAFTAEIDPGLGAGKGGGATDGVDEREAEYVIEEAEVVPTNLRLSVYPNPASDAMSVEYGLPDDAHVTLVIYDLLGREIRRLVEGRYYGGAYQVFWDTNDNGGRPVAAGRYFARLMSNDSTITQEIHVVR